jgi:hypothetical protein
MSSAKQLSREKYDAVASHLKLASAPGPAFGGRLHGQQVARLVLAHDERDLAPRCGILDFKDFKTMANASTHGGRRPGAGKPKGAISQTDFAAQLATIKATQYGKLPMVQAFDALESMKKIAQIFLEQVATEHDKLKRGLPGDRLLMNRCAEAAGTVCAQIVKYERPKLRAVMVVPPRNPTEGKTVKEFTLTIFDHPRKP